MQAVILEARGFETKLPNRLRDELEGLRLVRPCLPVVAFDERLSWCEVEARSRRLGLGGQPDMYVI